MNSSVVALTPVPEGRSQRLYAGGAFTTAGGVLVNRLARWDGTLSALGSGMDDSVRALMVGDDGTGPVLYAGGAFTVAEGIAANSIVEQRCR